MGILYHFLSTMNGVGGKPSPRIRSWENVTWLLPSERNLQSLKGSNIVQKNFLSGALQCTLLREQWILARRIYNECKRGGSTSSGTRRIISFCAPWKWSLSKWKESILPFLAKHHATLWTMSFYKFLASTVCSEVTLLQLSQHPYHRVKSFKENSSPLSVAANAFVTTVWSNLLFYLADLTVQQVSLVLALRKEYQWAVVRKDTTAKEKCLQTWITSSWDMFYQQSLRYWNSSLGSAMGSMVLPGWGTLAGIGLGEQWADHQDIPRSPPGLLKVFPFLRKYFAATTRSRHQSSSQDSPLQANALLCGCCQVNYFSSNSRHPTHVPISSKSCPHTLCRSCVDLCQVSELLESGVSGIAFSEQLAACPICNTPGAFSPHDLLINQSLCNAVALLERTESSEPSSIEIDIGTVKRFGRLSRFESSMSVDAHSLDTLSV